MPADLAVHEVGAASAGSPEAPDQRGNTTITQMTASSSRAVPLIASPSQGTRLLRPLVPGGLRSSVIALCATALGTGVLSMPLAMQTSGFAAGWAMLLLAAAMVAVSGDVLVRCSHEQEQKAQGLDEATACGGAGLEEGPAPGRTAVPPPASPGTASLSTNQVRSWNYLLELHIGPRAGLLLEAIVCLFGCGVSTMYFVFIYQFTDGILRSQFSHDIQVSHRILALVFSACVLPLSLPTSLGNMQWLTVFVFGVITGVIALLLVGLGECHGPSEPLPWFNISARGLLKSFCLFIFGFMYHMNLYTVYAGLCPPHAWGRTFPMQRDLADLVRMRRSMKSATLVNLVLVGVLSSAGAALWKGATLGNVMSNFTKDACRQEVMTASVIMQVALILSASFCIPLNMLQTRASLLMLLGAAFGERTRDRLGQPPLRHLLTTSIILGLALLASEMEDISSIIGVLSGTVGTALMFMLPAFFYQRSGLDIKRPFRRGATLAAFAFSTAAGLTNVVLTVLKI